jgi:hypothetical protein
MSVRLLQAPLWILLINTYTYGRWNMLYSNLPPFSLRNLKKKWNPKCANLSLPILRFVQYCMQGKTSDFEVHRKDQYIFNQCIKWRSRQDIACGNNFIIFLQYQSISGHITLIFPLILKTSYNSNVQDRLLSYLDFLDKCFMSQPLHLKLLFAVFWYHWFHSQKKTCIKVISINFKTFFASI